MNLKKVFLPTLIFAPFFASGNLEALAATREAPTSKVSTAKPGKPYDERRTMGRFFPNLGRNTVFLFAGDSLKALLVGAAATGGGAPFDGRLQRYFGGPVRRAQWWGDTSETLDRGYVMVPLTTALFGLGRISSHGHQRFRDMTYDFAQTMLVNALYTNALKYAVHRERPNGNNRYSFPSGHASDYFTCATVVGHHYGAKLGVPAFVLASLVGLGRLEKNAHYLSDVMAGATLGYLVGRTVVRENSAPLKGPGTARLSFGPEPRGRLAGRGETPRH